MPKPKRSTISNDPYAFIGTPTPQPMRDRPEIAEPPAVASKPAMEKITTPYPVELIERARDAAYWDRTTLAGILAQALADALDRMEKGRGEPYPPRQSELRGGRPVGTGKSK